MKKYLITYTDEAGNALRTLETPMTISTKEELQGHYLRNANAMLDVHPTTVLVEVKDAPARDRNRINTHLLTRYLPEVHGIEAGKPVLVMYTPFYHNSFHSTLEVKSISRITKTRFSVGAQEFVRSNAQSYPRGSARDISLYCADKEGLAEAQRWNTRKRVYLALADHARWFNNVPDTLIRELWSILNQCGVLNK